MIGTEDRLSVHEEEKRISVENVAIHSAPEKPLSDAIVSLEDDWVAGSWVVMIRTQNCLAQLLGNNQQRNGAAGVKIAVDYAGIFCHSLRCSINLHGIFQKAVPCRQ